MRFRHFSRDPGEHGGLSTGSKASWAYVAAAYIMDSFPIIQRKEERQVGEYRTKRVILEIYDAMAEAERSGVPYQTRLDPPPADPRVAHAAASAAQTTRIWNPPFLPLAVCSRVYV